MIVFTMFGINENNRFGLSLQNRYLAETVFQSQFDTDSDTQSEHTVESEDEIIHLPSEDDVKINQNVSADLEDFDRESSAYGHLLREYNDFVKPLPPDIGPDDCHESWPSAYILHFRWIENDQPLGFDIQSKQSKQDFLKYWAQELGIWKFLNQRESADAHVTLQMPDTFVIQANKCIFEDIERMEQTEQQMFANMFATYWVSDPGIMSMMDAKTQRKFLELGCKLDHRIANRKEEILHLMKQWFDQQCEIKDYKETKKASVNKSRPRGFDNDEWWPCGSKFWMNTWRRWMLSDHTVNSVKQLISDFQDADGIREKHDNLWLPSHPWILHAMHKSVCQINKIQEIHVKQNYQPNAQEAPIVYKRNKAWGFDPFSQDIRSIYETPRHFNAMMASLDEHFELRKGNPVHIRETKPSGKLHSCQTRLPRFGFWQFLEQITWICPKNIEVTVENIQETLVLTPGTFVYKPNDCLYGLIMSIKHINWTLKLVRHGSETMEEFHLRVIEDWDQLKNEKTLSDANVEFMPHRELILLPFQFKYQFCLKQDHNHFNENDQQLYLHLPDNLYDLKQMYRSVDVSDDLWIGSLVVSDIMHFDDPNIPDYNDDRALSPRWRWNVVLQDNHAQSPLNIPIISQTLSYLKNNLEDIWPGNVSRQTDITVFPYKVNCDGFEVRKNDNSVHSFKSIKDHFISPSTTYLLSKSFVIRIGMILENDDNAPFYMALTEEILYCLFVGVLCKEQSLLVIGLPTGFIVDGKEVKALTAIVGANGERIDYLTCISRHLSFLAQQLQAHRHYSVQVSQAVMFCNVFVSD